MISLMMHNVTLESSIATATSQPSQQQAPLSAVNTTTSSTMNLRRQSITAAAAAASSSPPVEELFQIDPEAVADLPPSILPLVHGGAGETTDFHAYSGGEVAAPALSPAAGNDIRMQTSSGTATKPQQQQSENLDSAQSHFLAALTYDEDHTPARTWLGRCYFLQGNYEMARAELERACRGGRVRGAKVWNAWHQLAMVYQVLGESNRAVECFAAALERESVSVPLMSLRGLEVLPRML